MLIAQASALADLWTREECAVLRELESRGATWCLERLGRRGKWRLLPYRAVGVSAGLLLCFRAEEATLDGETLGPITVALSPTAVSDGGGYTALWGGERGADHHAA